VKNTIIVGSGLSALMLARMIKKYKDTGSKIYVIEREASVGGQFGSINYGQRGYFDYGMHIYYESCVPEIDTLFTSLLPDDKWNPLVGNYKDAAGIFVNGRLQKDTPYIDLRTISEGKKREYIADLLLHISKTHNQQLPPENNAYDVLTNHYGKLITDEVFVPVLQKLYLNHASKLDEMATKLTAINRIALFDTELMLDLMKSDELRARLCFPNQYTLPPYRTDNQKGFYPKEYGMFRVLDKFKESLEQDGVVFLTSAMITKLNIEQQRVKSISIKEEKGESTLEDINEIYWTAGLPPLAASLGVNMQGFNYDKRPQSYYVNFLFDKKPEMDLLYYFYCFEKGNRSFRVTNYSNYCPGANNGRGYPVCVEVWPEAEDTEIENIATKELKQFGVIDDSYKILFVQKEKVHGGGFPLPTITNVSNMNTIREKIEEKEIKNIIPIGVMAEKNVFFIKDILIDAYSKVTNR